MKVAEICNIIENIAPKEHAEEWDNVGLLVGDRNAEVSGIVICVDLTLGAINACITDGYNLIVTHHPAIFRGLKSVVEEEHTSALIAKCIKHNINVYSAHTNMDMSDEGINFATAHALNVAPQRFLSDGLGVYGDYNGNFEQLVVDIVRLTNDTIPKTYKFNDQKKQKIAFIGGSGGRIEEIVAKCKQFGIDTIISSEFKHSIILELVANNINIIQIGHFESEAIFVQIIYDLLKSKTDNLHKFVSLI